MWALGKNLQKPQSAPPTSTAPVLSARGRGHLSFLLSPPPRPRPCWSAWGAWPGGLWLRSKRLGPVNQNLPGAVGPASPSLWPLLCHLEQEAAGRHGPGDPDSSHARLPHQGRQVGPAPAAGRWARLCRSLTAQPGPSLPRAIRPSVTPSACDYCPQRRR